MRYMQKNASNQSLVCKLSLNVVVNHDLALFIYLFIFASLLLWLERESKTEEKKKNIDKGREHDRWLRVVLDRGNQQLKNGDK